MVKTFSSRDIYKRIDTLLSEQGEPWKDPETSDDYRIYDHMRVGAGVKPDERSVCFAMRLKDRMVTVYTPDEFLYIVFAADGSVKKPPAEPTLGMIDEWLEEIEQQEGTIRTQMSES